MFKEFKVKIQQSFADLIKKQPNLFVTDLDKDLLWETYLNSFEDPAIRQGNTCNCCRQFIKYYGNVVAIIDNKMVSIWNFEQGDGDEFQKTVKDMNALVLGSKIKNIFVSDTKHLGTNKSTQRLDTGNITWEHLYFELPKALVTSSSLSMDSIMGTNRDNRNVFKRSLDELTMDSIETVLELMAQNSLYKGEEFKALVTEFSKYKKEYELVADKDLYAWEKLAKTSVAVLKIRNSAIGTLLTSISEGKELDHAVNAFETMVAPSNYKRPIPVVTKRMVEDAEKTVSELGLTESLKRRHAISDDISVNNLLFVDRDIKKNLGIFDEMKDNAVINPKTLTKVEEISADTFIKDVLPTCKSIELLFENGHLNNLVSLITAKDQEAPSLFKWENLFSWSYTGGITDSLKERVKAAGGKVDGVLRFSIQWNEDGKSICDLDAHAIEPNGTHIYYGSYKNRETTMTGMLDVDMIRPREVGVENITWSNISRMQEGKYDFYINNYDGNRNNGFTAQIEFDGQTYEFNVDTHVSGNTRIAEVTYSRSKGFSIKTILDSKSSVVSKDKWNLSTNKFQKVSMIMNSPNHWDNNIGNRHLFFILDGAKADEPVRGFFNEFLKEDLLKNKRVFELLGDKLKIEADDAQLSGLGFSSTQRNHVICRVEGKFKRLLKIVF